MFSFFFFAHWLNACNEQSVEKWKLVTCKVASADSTGHKWPCGDQGQCRCFYGDRGLKSHWSSVKEPAQSWPAHTGKGRHCVCVCVCDKLLWWSGKVSVKSASRSRGHAAESTFKKMLTNSTRVNLFKKIYIYCHDSTSESKWETFFSSCGVFPCLDCGSNDRGCLKWYRLWSTLRKMGLYK